MYQGMIYKTIYEADNEISFSSLGKPSAYRGVETAQESCLNKM